MTKKSDKIPRFVLGLTDTKTGMNVNIATDKLGDFVKFIPEEKRKNPGRTEFEALLLFFAKEVGKKSGHAPVVRFDDAGKPREEM